MSARFRHPPLFLPVLVFAVYAVQLPLSPLVYLWADTVFQAPFTYSSPPVSATFYLLLPRFCRASCQAALIAI